jgi:hypothetical protein
MAKLQGSRLAKAIARRIMTPEGGSKRYRMRMRIGLMGGKYGHGKETCGRGAQNVVDCIDEVLQDHGLQG